MYDEIDNNLILSTDNEVFMNSELWQLLETSEDKVTIDVTRIESHRLQADDKCYKDENEKFRCPDLELTQDIQDLGFWAATKMRAAQYEKPKNDTRLDAFMDGREIDAIFA